jgi:hypothetical protein
MTTPWHVQREYIRAHEAELAAAAQSAQRLAEWRHATGRLRWRHRLRDWYEAALGRLRKPLAIHKPLATHERHVEGVRTPAGLGREVAGVGRG